MVKINKNSFHNIKKVKFQPLNAQRIKYFNIFASQRLNITQNHKQ